MKKKNFKNLSLNKNSVSNLSPKKIYGGIERSERRTNCEFCPETHDPCISIGGCPQSGEWTCHNTCNQQ